MTHICVGNLTITGSGNGLSPGRRQAITWTNAGILLIGPLGTNFSGILIGILTFSFAKMLLKVSSAKWQACCLGLNVLIVFLQCPESMPMTSTRLHWSCRCDSISRASVAWCIAWIPSSSISTVLPATTAPCCCGMPTWMEWWVQGHGYVIIWPAKCVCVCVGGGGGDSFIHSNCWTESRL